MAIIILILLLYHPVSDAVQNGILERQELLDSRYHVEWKVNFHTKKIIFKIIAEWKGWIGFGLSYTGGMKGADIVIGGVHPNGTGYLSDYHGVGNVKPVLDLKQNWELTNALQNETHTTLQFSRDLDTCDQEDVPITESTLKIIWALGNSDVLNYHGNANRGALHVNFLDPPMSKVDLTKYKSWTMAQPLTLPGRNGTVYWCTFFKGVVSSKNHIVGFDMFLNGSNSQRHTHHADVYRCKPPKGQKADEFFSKFLGNGYDCYFSNEYVPNEHCEQFELQWSMGGQLTMFPEDIGLPMGTESAEYFKTEIHYDNPEHLENLQVHSGHKIYYTNKLRKMEAGLLQLGVPLSKTYSLTIPPNSEGFTVASHCSAGCTKYFPKNGISVFMYLLHSHLSGRMERIRHFRRGKELPYLANDDHYDFNYQSNRLFKKIKVLPGDHLTLECTYDNKWKMGNATLGGWSTTDEMCQAFLMFTPRSSAVNQCGSAFAQEEMLKFMNIQEATNVEGENDPVVQLPMKFKGMYYSQVVNGINWSKSKRKEFQYITRYGRHQSTCN